MKLVRFGESGLEKPGLIDAAGKLRDLSAYCRDIGGTDFSQTKIAELSHLNTDSLPLVQGNPRLGACIAAPGKFICIGLNYADHAAETGKAVPPEPVVFMKATSALCGPNDPIEIPRGATKTDWEVELGVVIGARAKYVDEANAPSYVAGYCTVNDVSERAFQSERQGQWSKGKSHDTFGPVGPWLVTADEVADPQNLKLWCEVDGHRFQNGSTATMVYSVAFLIHYLSQFMTLHPGDIIATGTPPGCGMGVKPNPIFLKPNQRIRLEVEGLGTQDHITTQA